MTPLDYIFTVMAFIGIAGLTLSSIHIYEDWRRLRKEARQQHNDQMRDALLNALFPVRETEDKPSSVRNLDDYRNKGSAS